MWELCGRPRGTEQTIDGYTELHGETESTLPYIYYDGACLDKSIYGDDQFDELIDDDDEMVRIDKHHIGTNDSGDGAKKKKQAMMAKKKQMIDNGDQHVDQHNGNTIDETRKAKQIEADDGAESGNTMINSGHCGSNVCTIL